MKNSAKYIADRIRLMIATKQFQVGEMLPSTRELGRQLEVSFHTVRKAYGHLENEGLITGEQGRGFIINRQNTSLDKSQRLEIGAEKLKEVLEELVGYGLDESEIEMLVAEQVSYMEWPDRIQSCATIGETRELATILAKSIREQVGVKSDTLSLADYDKALTYDALFIPIQLVSEFHGASDSTRIMPVVYHYDADVLISIVTRASLDAIGLVTAEENSIQKIIKQLKSSINFSGSFVAGATYGKSLPLFVRNTDLVVYTPACARLVEQKVPEKKRLKLNYILSDKSADMIRAELWDQ
ncbi:GntR family transcriptional regulator [Rhodohalobacter sp. SW132]|uniref:GntR family transcriptional regulator n=1 Tax=Rhodohalobacter sp. SW132 TaxID=2293433 RepID=UPI000E21E498|nr:GntR family transcriptional regulator [Rhodohalobacter sp. SW132]REL38902.1 GntR family transcriptional regulator [Rhodohalobacter sp. SW132]